MSVLERIKTVLKWFRHVGRIGENVESNRDEGERREDGGIK